jgi:hypothetical protein
MVCPLAIKAVRGETDTAMGGCGLEEHPKRQKTNEKSTAKRFPVVMIQFS